MSSKFDYRVAIQDVCDALNALVQLKLAVEADLDDECQTPLTSPSATTVRAAENFFNCIVLLSPYLCLSLNNSNTPYQNVIASTDQVTDYGVCAVNQCNLGMLFIFRKVVLVDTAFSLALLLDSTNTDIYDPANSPTVLEAIETLIDHYTFIKDQWIKNYRNKLQIPLIFLREVLDVFQTDPQDNQTLVYQSGNWFNQFLTLAKGLSDVTITNPGTNTGTSGTGVDVLQYDPSGCGWVNDCLDLDNLCDVLITNPGTNTGTSGTGVDVLQYDASGVVWVNDCLDLDNLCDVLITNPGADTGTSGNGIETLRYSTGNSRWENGCLGIEDLCDVVYAEGGPANNDILFYDAANMRWTTQENPDNVFGIRSDAQKRVFRWDEFGASGTPEDPGDGVGDAISTTSTAWIDIGGGFAFWETPDPTSVFAMEAAVTSDYLLIFTGTLRRSGGPGGVVTSQIRITADESGVATPSLDVTALENDTLTSINPVGATVAGEGSSIATIYTVKDVQEGTIFNIQWRRNSSGSGNTIFMDSGIFLIFAIASTTS